MSTVAAVAVSLANLRDTAAYSWTPLTSSNAVGDGQFVGNYKKKSVMVFGTFGSATVVIQGSIDGTNYATLTDQAGAALSFTAASKVMAIPEPVAYIRPSTSGGDGTQSLTVQLMASQNG